MLCALHAQSCPTLAGPRLQPTKLFPWDSPGKNTGMGCHFLLQGKFLTQGSNLSLLGLLHWQVDSFPLCHLGSPGPINTLQLFLLKTFLTILDIYIFPTYLFSYKIWYILPPQKKIHSGPLSKETRVESDCFRLFFTPLSYKKGSRHNNI